VLVILFIEICFDLLFQTLCFWLGSQDFLLGRSSLSFARDTKIAAFLLSYLESLKQVQIFLIS
jgi:hypothetical protein